MGVQNYPAILGMEFPRRNLLSLGMEELEIDRLFRFTKSKFGELSDKRA
ncbi:MAG: hypothetical protein ACJATF_004132, partial [Flavobacteriales bacterium]